MFELFSYRFFNYIKQLLMKHCNLVLAYTSLCKRDLCV